VEYVDQLDLCSAVLHEVDNLAIYGFKVPFCEAAPPKYAKCLVRDMLPAHDNAKRFRRLSLRDQVNQRWDEFRITVAGDLNKNCWFH
jgi:hypothetical protein